MRLFLVLTFLLQLTLQFFDSCLQRLVFLSPLLLIFEKLLFDAIEVPLILFLAVVKLLEEGVATEAHLLDLVLIINPLFFQHMAILSQFLYLHLIVEIIADLSVGVLQLHSQGFNLQRKSLDLHCLEYNNELQLARKVNLFVTGQMLYS